MPPKGKGKKVEKAAEPVDQLSAVDRQFYELTITDINRKLATLRTRNGTLEERAEELELKLKEMEEDRTDVTAYLNRTLRDTMSRVEELEDQLTELSKVRLQENVECRNKMTEWDIKYKAMYEQLTSEIKLLTGKLNSMEEFRVQRDELLAKFDAQETEIKVQTKKHKEKIYELEIKFMADKFRLKKEVERRLLELSIEFRKYNEVKVASHTQRLVRENISLNNEMDRMMYTQGRLQKENTDMLVRDKMVMGELAVDHDEKERLVKTCRSQLDIIEQLTEKYEELMAKNVKLEQYKKRYLTSDNALTECGKQMEEFKFKMNVLEQNVDALHSERHTLLVQLQQEKMLYNRVFDIIKKIRFTIQTVVNGQGTYEEEDDAEFYESQRENLIHDLLTLMDELDSREIHQPSLPSIPSISQIYQQGDMGVVPKYSFESYKEATSEIHLETVLRSGSVSTLHSDGMRPRYVKPSPSEPIIDVRSGSKIVLVESLKKIVPEDGEEEEPESEVSSELIEEDDEDDERAARQAGGEEEEPEEGDAGEDMPATGEADGPPGEGAKEEEYGEIIDVADAPLEDDPEGAAEDLE